MESNNQGPDPFRRGPGWDFRRWAFMEQAGSFRGESVCSRSERQSHSCRPGEERHSPDPARGQDDRVAAGS